MPTGTRLAGRRAAATAERRERVLAAALELAREGGYEAVQMRDVASRAEVALGTLYRHFSSKDQLLLAALGTQAAQLRSRLEQHPPRGDTPAERVADALRRACRTLERAPRLTGAMVTAMFSSDPDTAESKDAVRTQMGAIIAHAAGDEVDDLDAVVDVLGHVWIATMAYWVGGLRSTESMSESLERAARLVLR